MKNAMQLKAIIRLNSLKMKEGNHLMTLFLLFRTFIPVY